MGKKEKTLFSTAEVAKILGISRVAVFKRIRSGVIKAEKVGRAYLIPRSEVYHSLEEGTLTEARKKEIDRNLDLIVREYSVALKMLGQE